jgi:hypothetical protein
LLYSVSHLRAGDRPMRLNRDMLYLAAIAALLIATMLPGIG